MNPQAVIAIIENDLGQVLAVWNRRYECFTLPGGKIEPCEIYQEAIIREVKEETDLDVTEIHDVRDALVVDPAKLGVGEGLTRVITVYCKCKGEPRVTAEGLELRWMTCTEFVMQTPFRVYTLAAFAIHAVNVLGQKYNQVGSL